MKAAIIQEPGPAEAIRWADLPDPKPQTGQVLVRVEAVTVNPIDLYIRAGTIPLPLPKPYIIGRDMAGRVVQSGPGATRFPPGKHVWCVNQGNIFDQGLSAELVAVDESWLLPTPEGIQSTEAAALALVGSTAYLGLFGKARLKKGETLFVNGGSGGVGSSVVQMGKAVGARVITTAGSPEKARRCRKLGADEVILYKEEKLGEALRRVAPQGIDVWYETLREPDLETSIPALKTGGRIVLMSGRGAHPAFPLGSFYTRDCKILGLALFNATVEEMHRAGEEMNRWLIDGVLRANIDRVMKLSEAAQAHRLLEESSVEGKGTVTGKIVMTLD